MVRPSRVASVNIAMENLGFGTFQLRVLLLLGVVCMADMISTTVEIFLASHLECRWVTAFPLSYAHHIGSTFGAIISGVLADRFGRRSVLLLACVCNAYYTMISASAKHSAWFMTFRCLQGASGAAIKCTALTLVVELLPRNSRGKFITTYQFFSTIGLLVTTLLAWALLPLWRVLVFMTAMPLIVVGIVALILLPRSPFHLFVKRDIEGTDEVIKEIALSNRIDPPPEIELCQAEEDFDEPINRCRLSLAATIILLLWLLTGTTSVSSYNVAIKFPLTAQKCVSPDFLMSQLALSRFSTLKNPSGTDNSCCHVSLDIDYKREAERAVHFAIGGAIAFLMVDALGRRRTMGFTGVMATFLFLPLNFCLPAEARNVLLVLSESGNSALRTALIIFTLEVMPTSHRATGFGCCVALDAIGSMLTPLVTLLATPRNRATDAYIFNTVILLLAALLAFILPVETARRPLPDTVLEATSRLSQMELSDGRDKRGHFGMGEGYKTFSETDSTR